MKNVFKNMRGAGLGGLLVMGVVLAMSVVLAGGLYFAKLSRGMELNAVNDEIAAHRTIAPIVASLKVRRTLNYVQQDIETNYEPKAGDSNPITLVTAKPVR